MIPAYQLNSYQNNAYQVGLEDIPAFDGCAFQFDAFQSAPCPNPPEPTLDGHDAGRKKRHKKALKRLQALEVKRMEMRREFDDNRKLQILKSVDPKAYERAMKAKEANKPIKISQKANKLIQEVRIAQESKVDRQIARLQKLQQNLEYKLELAQNLGKLHAERQAREKAIADRIREADDELALMMMM